MGKEKWAMGKATSLLRKQVEVYERHSKSWKEDHDAATMRRLWVANSTGMWGVQATPVTSRKKAQSEVPSPPFHVPANSL